MVVAHRFFHFARPAHVQGILGRKAALGNYLHFVARLKLSHSTLPRLIRQPYS